MKKKSNIFVYMFRSFVYRVCLSGRMLAFMSIFAVTTFIYIFFQGVRASKFGYQIGPIEMVPFFTACDVGMVLYYIVYILTAGGILELDGIKNEMIRLGKRNWVLEQLFYLVGIAVVQYLILTIVLFFAFLPAMVWNNSWNSLLISASNDTGRLLREAGITEGIWNSSCFRLMTPLTAYLITFLLYAGCSVLLGMVQLIGNVFFRRHTGTFLSVVLVAATLVFVYTPITGKPLVKSIALLIKHSVLPCEKASFHLLSLHQNFSVITEIIFAILYYLCGVVLFTGIAYYFCRKKELDWK